MNSNSSPPAFGSEKLRMPPELREPLKKHLKSLKEHYEKLNWAGKMGFGSKPALLIIDLALWWTDPECFPMGSNMDSVVEANVELLNAARHSKVPIIYTTYKYDPSEPLSPYQKKLHAEFNPAQNRFFELDPRLQRRKDERIIAKPYASAFKSTNLQENLVSLGIDTLIVTGVSTSHCIYATCRDAIGCYRVIVPEEAVGDRCEIMHEVNLLDIHIDLGDVLPTSEVSTYLANHLKHS